MSDEAKKTIETIQQGNLPPLKTISLKGTQSSPRGIDHSTYGLQYLNEDTHVSSNTDNQEN